MNTTEMTDDEIDVANADDSELVRRALIMALSRDGFEINPDEMPSRPEYCDTILMAVQERDVREKADLTYGVSRERFYRAIGAMKLRREVISFAFGPNGTIVLMPSVPSDADRKTRRMVIQADNRQFSKLRRGAEKLLQRNTQAKTNV